MGCRDKLSIVTLSVGTRLIVKDETEILILKTLREEMIRISHFTDSEDEAMLRQTKRKIFLAKHEQRLETKI